MDICLLASVVSQVEICATGSCIVQKGPTNCGVSLWFPHLKNEAASARFGLLRQEKKLHCLYLIEHHGLKVYGRMEVWLHAFVILTLHGVEIYALADLPTGKEPLLRIS